MTTINPNRPVQLYTPQGQFGSQGANMRDCQFRPDPFSRLRPDPQSLISTMQGLMQKMLGLMQNLMQMISGQQQSQPSQGFEQPAAQQPQPQVSAQTQAPRSEGFLDFLKGVGSKIIDAGLSFVSGGLLGGGSGGSSIGSTVANFFGKLF